MMNISMRFLHAALAWFVLAAVFCGTAPAHPVHADGVSLLCAVDDLDQGIADDPVVVPELSSPLRPYTIETESHLERLVQAPRPVDVLGSAPKTSPPSA